MNIKNTQTIENLKNKLEEKDKDCETMFKIYQDQLMKYNISTNLISSLKDDIKKLEDENNSLNKKIDITIGKYNELLRQDEEMIKILNAKGFNDSNELYDFIDKYKDHKCKEQVTKISRIHSAWELYEEENNTLNSKNKSFVNRETPLNRFKCIVNKYIKNNKEEINKKVLIKRIKIYLEKNRKLSFDEICNIPLHPITSDEETLLNINILEDDKNNTPFKSSIKDIHNKKLNIPSKTRNKKVITNQKVIVDKTINNIVNNLDIIKSNDNKLYNILYEKNRKDIDLYSYLHSNIDSLEIVENVDIKIDSNKYRLKRTCSIFDKIKNTPGLYNSEYIFNYYTFKEINKKGVQDLLNKLDILYTNSDNNDDEKICNICFTNEIEDEDNGACLKCLNNLI